MEGQDIEMASLAEFLNRIDTELKNLRAELARLQTVVDPVPAIQARILDLQRIRALAIQPDFQLSREDLRILFRERVLE